MAIRRQFLTLMLAAFLQAGGQPVNLPVTAAGWKFGGGTYPYGTNGCSAGDNADSCTYDLGKSPLELQGGGPTITGFYTVQFSVVNYFPNYPAYYTVQLDFGTQELCEMSGWGSNVPMQVTMICPSPGYLIVDKSMPGAGPAQGAKNLVLSFHVSNWRDLADNFSLTFTPTQ